MTMNFLSLYFVVALAVNFASLNSVKTGGPALTAMDPFMGSLFLLALWFFTYVSGRASTFRAVVCFLGGTASRGKQGTPFSSLTSFRPDSVSRFFTQLSSAWQRS